MLLCGFLLCIRVGSSEAKRKGLPDFAYDLGLVMLLAGLVGGRITYYLQFYDRYAGKSFLEFFKIWEGGLVFYGGAIGGLLAGVIFIRRKQLPLADALDVAAVATPVAMAFGRLGCFLHGCCHGGRCDAGYSLGVVFPQGSPVHTHQLENGWISAASEQALPVHPVQLYQFTHDMLLFALLLLYARSGRAPRGGLMPLLFVMYGVGRFSLEALRGDHTATFTGWTFSQNLSILLLLPFLAVFIALLVRAKGFGRGGATS
jgi:phosphatidylglycerol:prolipoprotein diacylglycerol transferase